MIKIRLLSFYVNNFFIIQFVFYFILVQLCSYWFNNSITYCVSSDPDDTSNSASSFWDKIGVSSVASFLLSEPSDLETKDHTVITDYVIMKPCVAIANLMTFDATPSDSDSGSDSNNNDSSSDTSESDTDPLEKYSPQIIFNLYRQYTKNCDSLEIFLTKGMDFMKTQFPDELLIKDKTEMQQEDNIFYQFQKKADAEVSINSQKDIVDYISFKAMMNVYNIAVVTNCEDNLKILQVVFESTVTKLTQQHLR